MDGCNGRKQNMQTQREKVIFKCTDFFLALILVLRSDCFSCLQRKKNRSSLKNVNLHGKSHCRLPKKQSLLWELSAALCVSQYLHESAITTRGTNKHRMRSLSRSSTHFWQCKILCAHNPNCSMQINLEV